MSGYYSLSSCDCRYTHKFFIDLEAFRNAQAEYYHIREHGLPSRAAFLELDKYHQLIKPKHGRPNLWEDHVEDAFFQGNGSLTTANTVQVLKRAVSALKDTKVARPSRRIVNILYYGEKSVWVSVLQRMNISPTRRVSSRSQVVAYIIEAKTGQRRDWKGVRRHINDLQTVYKNSPMPKFCSPTVASIVSMLDEPPYAMHDTIYNLLCSVPLKIDDTEAEGVNSVNTLDFLIESISPAFRQAIESIQLRYKTKQMDLTKFLDTFQHENLPGLRELYIQCGEQGKMLRAPPICFMSGTEHWGTHSSVD